MKAEERVLLAAFPWDDPGSRVIPLGSTYAYMCAVGELVDLDRMLRFEDMEQPPNEWDIVFAWRSFLHGLEIMSKPSFSFAGLQRD
jgi:hypothetical protein